MSDLRRYKQLAYAVFSSTEEWARSYNLFTHSVVMRTSHYRRPHCTQSVPSGLVTQEWKDMVHVCARVHVFFTVLFLSVYLHRI